MDTGTSHHEETGTEEPRVATQPNGVRGDRSIPELLRSIGTDTATLIRKEVQLAKQELMEAMTARLMAAGAAAAAGLMAVFALVFLGLAGATALDNVLRPWASRLIVGGAFLLIAAGAGLFAMRRLKKPPLAPEETVRTVKEDVKWAKAQLKR